MIASLDIDLISPPFVLIAENDAIQAQLLVSLVRQLGCVPLGPVATAAAALERCQHHWPDVALISSQLSGEPDGTELARQLKELDELPLVFLAAAGDEATRKRIQQSRPLAVLSKPYQSVDILDVLQRFLIACPSPASRQPDSPPRVEPPHWSL